jgi:hypothetical protein
VRQIAVLSVALVVSLVASYFTWTDDGEEPTDEVVAVYHATESDLQKLTWKGEDLEVIMERRKDDRGEYLWVESTETKRHKKHDNKEEKKEGEDHEDHPEDHPEDPAETPPTETPAEGTPAEAPATPEPEPPPTVTVTKFVANAQGEETWKAFAPLNALRELDASGADPTVLGLQDSKTTLEVVRGSGTLKLVVGGETYGNKDRYVGLDNKVYLVDDGTLRPLQFASSRLMERSLFPYQETDIDKVMVEIPGGKQLAYVQQNKDDRAKAYWARAETPDKTDDVGGTWLGKIFKLKLKDYVDASTVTGTLEPVVTYTVSGKDGDWRIELFKVTEGETTTWYAKSPYNRSMVTLTESLARNVVDDLASLQ